LKDFVTTTKQSEASLQETISILVKKNHTLYNENTELQEYIDETKEALRIAQGRRRADSGSLTQYITNTATTSEPQPLKIEQIPQSSLLS